MEEFFLDGLGVFPVDDCDLYVADSFESAVKLAMENTGCDRDDYFEDGLAMSEKALLETHWRGEERTIIEFIENQKSAGEWKPGFFASTEF